MEKWRGSAGVCVNDIGQVLMVLQGKPEEEKVWSVPSGGQEQGETLEECCIREIHEETGYEAKVVGTLFEKVGIHDNIEFTVTYFQIEIVGGMARIQDPDNLIYDISWKSIDEIMNLELSFPEDRDFLMSLKKKWSLPN